MLTWILWVLILALGATLLILGALPIGRFPGFASEAAILRPPYGRILGGIILLYFFVLRVIFPNHSPTALIILSALLLIAALICMILSLNEPLR